MKEAFFCQNHFVNISITLYLLTAIFGFDKIFLEIQEHYIYIYVVII